MQCFKLFWSQNLAKQVVVSTNQYSVQKTGASVVNCTEDELEKFTGMHIKMGVVKLPCYTMYWSNEMRYPPLADVMPRKRFEKLKRYLHFVDNARYDESIGGKLFKRKDSLLVVQQGKSPERMPFDEQQSDEGCWPWTS